MMGFNFNPTLNHSCSEVFQTTQQFWAACGNLGNFFSCCPKKNLGTVENSQEMVSRMLEKFWAVLEFLVGL
jgi:hypothetical protein